MSLLSLTTMPLGFHGVVHVAAPTSVRMSFLDGKPGTVAAIPKEFPGQVRRCVPSSLPCSHVTDGNHDCGSRFFRLLPGTLRHL